MWKPPHTIHVDSEKLCPKNFEDHGLGFVHAQNMAVVLKQGVAPQVCLLQLPALKQDPWHRAALNGSSNIYVGLT